LLILSKHPQSASVPDKDAAQRTKNAATVTVAALARLARLAQRERKFTLVTNKHHAPYTPSSLLAGTNSASSLFALVGLHQHMDSIPMAFTILVNNERHSQQQQQ
jgi:hypothetical protein